MTARSTNGYKKITFLEREPNMRKSPIVLLTLMVVLTVLVIMGLYTLPTLWTALKDSPEVQRLNQGDSKPSVDGDAFSSPWDLKALYKDLTVAQSSLNRLKTLETHFKTYESQLGDRKVLENALADYLDLQMTSERLTVYAALLKDSDLSQKKYSDLDAKVSSQVAQMNEDLSFFVPEVKKLSEAYIRSVQFSLPDQMKRLLASLYGEQDFGSNPEEERLLQLLDGLSGTYENTYKDFWGKAEYKENVNYEDFYSPNDNRRKVATEESMQRQRDNIDFLASNLEGKMNYDNTFAKAYQYESSLDMVLAQDGVTKEAFNGYIEATHEALPILNKWILLKQKALKLDRPLAFYDLQMPLSDHSTRVTLDEAKTMVVESTKVYGQDYGTWVDKAFKDHWIDPYPRGHKYDGSYTWGTYGVHPYLLLNYTNDLMSAETLAHEMGHAINFQLSALKQDFLNYQNPIFKAEIASTANEVLFLESRLKAEKRPEVRKELLSAYADLIIGTAFEQMKATEFEMKIHQAAQKGKDLSGTYLNELWKGLNQTYYGKQYKASALDELGWTKLDHLYWNYYMYKYTTGLAAGHYAAEKMISGDQAFTNDFITFLSSGSKDPITELKAMGIQMDSNELLKELYQKLDQILVELKTLEEQ